MEARHGQSNHLLDERTCGLRGDAAGTRSLSSRASHPVIYKRLGVRRQVLEVSSTSSPCELAETNEKGNTIVDRHLGVMPLDHPFHIPFDRRAEPRIPNPLNLRGKEQSLEHEDLLSALDGAKEESSLCIAMRPTTGCSPSPDWRAATPRTYQWL